MIRTPIFFLIFSRPEQSARTFAAIRAARPSKLPVVADGPRLNRAGEEELARARVPSSPASIGRAGCCGISPTPTLGEASAYRAVSTGPFGQAEGAVILEDDCLLDPSFFRYCAELLEHYRADERIMMISGDNLENRARRTSDSYYFSRLPHCWGWTTWRRARRHYDFTVADWPQRREARWLKPIARNPARKRYPGAKIDDRYIHEKHGNIKFRELGEQLAPKA